MNVKYNCGSAEIETSDLFSADKIFDCGQCFRFEPEKGGYSGIAFGKRIHIRQNEGKIIIDGTDKEDFENIWFDFFDFGNDYREINKSILSAVPEKRAFLEECEAVGAGIRILRQDPWETLVSFIISQNNNIPRIKKLIGALSLECGERIDVQDGEKPCNYYAFPSPEAVRDLGEKRLAEMKFGFRAGYIADAANKVCSCEINLSKLYNMSFEEAFGTLSSIRGVGPKVASCVLLFAYHKLGAFPIDVWIKKVIDKYFDGTLPSFGDYAGIAQQYLFYRERYIVSD